MSLRQIICYVYDQIRIFMHSWFSEDNENPPVMEGHNQNQDQNQGPHNQENERIPTPPPLPPPMPPFQLIAAMHVPFIRHNRPNLREILRPLGEVLVERPASPQPQLRLGKPWRIENQAENVQAIEKALEEFEKEEIPTKSEEEESQLS